MRLVVAGCFCAEALMRDPVKLSEMQAYWATLPLAKRRELEIEHAWESMMKPEFNSKLKHRAEKRMARVDSMPFELREIVYEYGLELVQPFLDHGVRRASSIRYLIDTVRCAEYPTGQVRFRFNTGPNRASNPLSVELDDEVTYSVVSK